MATKYESQEVYDTLRWSCYGNRWYCQTFRPQVSHQLTKIYLAAYRAGTPGTLYVRIKNATAGHTPTGEAIASRDISANAWTTNSDAAWYEIVLDAPVNLDADSYYCIELHIIGGDSSNCVNFKGTWEGAVYPRGQEANSTNGGDSWTTLANYDAAFQEWGEPILDPPTVATNAADGVDHEQATLHGTLTDDGGEACEVRFQYGKTTAYGTDTDWQEGKVSENTFEQLITGLHPDQLYHFRAQAKNTQGTTSGSDAEFTTSILPPVYGAMKKAQITHPALKTIRIIQHGQEVAKFDELSNPDENYIESGLTIQIPTPSTIEVTTLADQTWEFNIPDK